MNSSETVYALILARGGSKRIPGKNIKNFCGKPLIAWTIAQAQKSKYISRIIVSTDDAETALVAKKFGAEVPFMRPANIAGDLSTDLESFEHFLGWCRDHDGHMPDIVAHLRVTGPLRTTEDIDHGIELLLAHPEYDSVRAVVSAPVHPLKTYRLEGETLLPFIPESVSGMREPWDNPVQKLPKAYAAAGYFSAIRTKTISGLHSMSGKKVLGYVVNVDNATDIDTQSDLVFAEARMSERLRLLQK